MRISASIFRRFPGAVLRRLTMTSTDCEPTYSAAEERRWNRLNQVMSSFHEMFKQEFNTIYELADGSFSNRGMSLSFYLETAKQMNSHLTMHHTMEERFVFPFLARRMPQFSDSADHDSDGHINSHRAIHKGLDELSSLVYKFKKEPSSYSPTEMRQCLDGFRQALFSHLDQEVSDLRGENLKKYWTLKELDELAI